MYDKSSVLNMWYNTANKATGSNMIKNRLAKIMKETQTSQRQLAEAVGVNKATINKLAQQKPHELLTLLDNICNYYGIRIDQLLYNSETTIEEEEDKQP